MTGRGRVGQSPRAESHVGGSACRGRRATRWRSEDRGRSATCSRSSRWRLVRLVAALQLDRRRRTGGSAGSGRADEGQVPAAVGRPGAVRRLLRRGRPGLLQGSGPRRPAAPGRTRHQPVQVVAAGGADIGTTWVPKMLRRAKAARTSSTSPRSSSAPARSRFVQGQEHHPRRDLKGKSVGHGSAATSPSCSRRSPRTPSIRRRM